MHDDFNSPMHASLLSSVFMLWPTECFFINSGRKSRLNEIDLKLDKQKMISDNPEAIRGVGSKFINPVS